MAALCKCGCGQTAQREYLQGHNRRGTHTLDKYVVEDRGFASPCWVWTGRIVEGGYGAVQIAYRSVMAHRASYEAHRGPIPAGLQIDHLCRVRNCVNPVHLEAVTQQENLRRGLVSNGGHKPHCRRTHCARGHEFTEANSYWRRNGKRMCRACIQMRAANPPLGERAVYTHCARGHEFTEANTYRAKNGYRSCRICCALMMAKHNVREAA